MPDKTFEVVASYIATPGSENDVLTHLRRLAEASRQEDGNLSYEYFRGVEDPQNSSFSSLTARLQTSKPTVKANISKRSALNHHLAPAPPISIHIRLPHRNFRHPSLANF